MANVNVTIIKSGRSDTYGRPLVLGSSQNLESDAGMTRLARLMDESIRRVEQSLAFATITATW